LFIKNGGKVNKLINSFVFEKKDKCFIEYVNYCKKIREEGGERNILGKLLINSFYGGMGLREDFNQSYLTFTEEEFLEIKKNFDIEKYYKINSAYVILITDNFKYKNFFKKKIEKNSSRNVSYASAIASKARIKLFKAFKEVMEDGGKILYCDTDSIFAAYNKNNDSYLFKDKK
jgi:DNA polymerase elongation subunit (family B)